MSARRDSVPRGKQGEGALLPPRSTVMLIHP
jgi:hypothetical protein